jgi:hypothetical protein
MQNLQNHFEIFFFSSKKACDLLMGKNQTI